MVVWKSPSLDIIVKFLATPSKPMIAEGIEPQSTLLEETVTIAGGNQLPLTISHSQPYGVEKCSRSNCMTKCFCIMLKLPISHGCFNSDHIPGAPLRAFLQRLRSTAAKEIFHLLGAICKWSHQAPHNARGIRNQPIENWNTNEEIPLKF